LQPNSEGHFAEHPDILKMWYCKPKMVGFGESSKVVPKLLDHHHLDFEQGMSKLCMKSNSKVSMELLLFSIL
jgi:hypothetical protein